jgi:hypothetical protein
MKFFGIGDDRMLRLRQRLQKNEIPDFSIRARTPKETRLMRTAILTYLNNAVGLLAEQMPHKSGGPEKGGRHLHQRNDTMNVFRKQVLERTLKTMEEENAKDDSEATIPTNMLVLDLKAPIKDSEMTALKGVKRERDSESDDTANAMEINAYTKMYPIYRFSCMTKRTLYDLLIEDLQDGKLPHWPCRVKRGLSADGCSATYQTELRVPSLTYFLCVLRMVGNISFWKNPTFTKCNTCVTLRNCERRRTIAQSERDDIRKARNQHCFFIMSEVLDLYL